MRPSADHSSFLQVLGESYVFLQLLARICGTNFDRGFEVLIGHLQVMPPRNLLAVAHPGADHVRRKLLFELRLPAGPQVVPQLRPVLQAGPLDDPLELRQQVLSGAAVAGNKVRGTCRRVVKNPFCPSDFWG